MAVSYASFVLPTLSQSENSFRARNYLHVTRARGIAGTRGQTFRYPPRLLQVAWDKRDKRDKFWPSGRDKQDRVL
jgi:hypothetical protein